MMPGNKKESFAEQLLKGAREAAAHASGDREVVRASSVTRRALTAREVTLPPPERPSPTRIREIRDALDVSQAVFGELLNVSRSTVRAWEQGQRSPDGASLRLLEVAAERPSALLEVATRRGAVARGGDRGRSVADR
jgi:DNA-binding transcriptional regulator YiaG